MPIDLGLQLARGGSRERRQVAVRVGTDLTFALVDGLFVIGGRFCVGKIPNGQHKFQGDDALARAESLNPKKDERKKPGVHI